MRQQTSLAPHFWGNSKYFKALSYYVTAVLWEREVLNRALIYRGGQKERIFPITGELELMDITLLYDSTEQFGILWKRSVIFFSSLLFIITGRFFLILKGCMHPSVHGSTIYTSQDMAIDMSIDKWMDKENVVHTYNGILFSHKKRK